MSYIRGFSWAIHIHHLIDFLNDYKSFLMECDQYFNGEVFSGTCSHKSITVINSATGLHSSMVKI